MVLKKFYDITKRYEGQWCSLIASICGILRGGVPCQKKRIRGEYVCRPEIVYILRGEKGVKIGLLKKNIVGNTAAGHCRAGFWWRG